MNRAFVFFFGIALLFFSCGNFDYKGKGKDVPTAGDLELWVDHGDSLLFNQFKELFEKNYPKASIKLLYASETEILKAVNDGICRACVLHRNFDSTEINALENRNFKVRSMKIARTSAALMVNKQNSISQISIGQLGDILSRLKQGTPVSIPNMVIFDQAGGSNFRLLRDFYGKKRITIQSSQIRALHSPESVLKWIENHPEAIGVVNVNLIADRSDPSSAQWYDKLRVLKVESVTDSQFVYPFQSQMAANQYPFVSDMYFHDLQGYSGLASGFLAWIYSQPGQTLIKKSGLLPARDYGRTIELGSE
jgi:phosphate transport system substrate-binding protein